ncbi:MAG: hypothetical protein LBK27_08765 [Treponema sp.]|jgi:hypothetical protein|nr:hypothetical protein [Treponema sp.]
MINLMDLPMEFDTEKMRWEINVYKHLQNVPKNKDIEESIKTLNYKPNLRIYIQGDKNNAEPFYMELAKTILKDIEKYKDKSIKKIFEWMKLDKRIKKDDFWIDVINFSDLVYGCQGAFGYKEKMKGFTMVLSITNDEYYGYMEIIIKYTKSGWPKGIELMFN